MEKKCQVVLIPTETATGLFSQTMNIWGNNIWEKKLEFTTNETLIRNNHLISNRKAATNALDKYEFYYLYLVSDREIKEGDWYMASNNTPAKAILSNIIPKCPKIEATTDAYLFEHNLDREVGGFSGDIPLPKIDQSFMEEFVTSYNNGNPIKEVIIDIEKIKITSGTYPVKFGDKVKTRSDNTVIIHKLLELKYNRQDVMDAAFDYFDKFKDIYKTHGLLDPIKSVEWFDEKYPK